MTPLARGVERREIRRQGTRRADPRATPRIDHRAQDVSTWRRQAKPTGRYFDLHPLAPLLKRTHDDLVRAVLRAGNLVPGVFLFPVDVARVKGRKRTLGMTGTPDVLGWADYWPGIGIPVARTVAFECKVGRDRLRPEQRAFLDKLRAAGGIAAEVRSAEQAVSLLRDGGQ